MRDFPRIPLSWRERTSVSDEELHMHFSKTIQHRSNKARQNKITVAILAALILPIAAAAQTAYYDPQGRYDVQIPAGWQLAPGNSADQIVIQNGAAQALITVLQQDASSAMTASQFVDGTGREIQSRCPTFQNRLFGQLTLAGSPGVYSIFVCNDAKSPTVAEASSALTAGGVLIGFTAIAPLAQYYESLPALDGIRDSLHLAGEQSPPAADIATESLAMTELKKACVVGVFAQVECARRISILLGKEELAAAPAVAPAAAPAAAPAPGSVYHDPQGRFSFWAPQGWSAIPQGEKGALGVQLRSGSNWINVLPADLAASTSEVVLHQEQKIAVQSKSSRKMPFGPAGLTQILGNGTEVNYDHFSAVTPQGEAVETYIGGVGNIAGSSHGFLLMVAGFGAEQKDEAGPIFLSVAQSIVIPAH